MQQWCHGVHTGAQNASGVVFWAENTLKPRKDTAWSVPIVYWSDSWMSSVLHNCNPMVFSVVFSLSCETMFIEKQEFLEKQEFFAPMAATMIYYEDTSRLIWTQLFINTWTYLHVCSLKLRWHVLTWCRNQYICTAQNVRLVYQSTAAEQVFLFLLQKFRNFCTRPSPIASIQNGHWTEPR